MDQSPSSEIETYLFWAGKQLLSLHVKGCFPSSFRSYWPDYPNDKNTAFGYTSLKFHPPQPGASDIQLMDEILNLILLIPNITQRRIINSRSLISPRNDRHIFSW